LLEWRSFEQLVDLDNAAVAYILACAQSAIARQQRFRLVMAGGQTPRGVYTMLRDAQTDWSCWHIYFSDERCVAVDDAQSNSRMVRDCLLDHVPIPAFQIHVIPTELGVDEAAANYDALLQTQTPFDLVLLGLGEDGHTASLFPGQVLNSDRWAVAVHHAPKPPSKRVSLSVRALRATANVLVMASGIDKRDAIASWRAGTLLPIQTVTEGLNGLVVTDRSAVDSRRSVRLG
jgi:6-phosphogluconolactonase